MFLNYCFYGYFLLACEFSPLYLSPGGNGEVVFTSCHADPSKLFLSFERLQTSAGTVYLRRESSDKRKFCQNNNVDKKSPVVRPVLQLCFSIFFPFLFLNDSIHDIHCAGNKT